jgi:large subunit ribosomal protein L6
MSISAAQTVTIPEGIEVSLDGMVVTVKGPKGQITKDFAHSKLRITLDGNSILLEAPGKGKRIVAVVGTIAAHLRNMFKGVTVGHIYNMKVIYAHFPITVKVAGKNVNIENFMGERSKRIANIVGSAKVVVDGEELTIEGVDKDEVGQTAANIHMAAHVKKMDPRVFQDGVYVSERR